jgi:hypothetical protein
MYSPFQAMTQDCYLSTQRQRELKNKNPIHSGYSQYVYSSFVVTQGFYVGSVHVVVQSFCSHRNRKDLFSSTARTSGERFVQGAQRTISSQ